MPTYEYVCPKCGPFEMVHSMSSGRRKRCPKCRSGIQASISTGIMLMVSNSVEAERKLALHDAQVAKSFEQGGTGGLSVGDFVDWKYNMEYLTSKAVRDATRRQIEEDRVAAKQVRRSLHRKKDGKQRMIGRMSRADVVKQMVQKGRDCFVEDPKACLKEAGCYYGD